MNKCFFIIIHLVFCVVQFVLLTYHAQNRVNEWSLFNANSAIFQLYHGKNKLFSE